MCTQNCHLNFNSTHCAPLVPSPGSYGPEYVLAWQACSVLLTTALQCSSLVPDRHLPEKHQWEIKVSLLKREIFGFVFLLVICDIYLCSKEYDKIDTKKGKSYFYIVLIFNSIKTKIISMLICLAFLRSPHKFGVVSPIWFDVY